MRTWLASVFLGGFVLLFASAIPCFGQDAGAGAGGGSEGGGVPDLMDLEIPGQGTGDHLELPPLKSLTAEPQRPKKGEDVRPTVGAGIGSRSTGSSNHKADEAIEVGTWSTKVEAPTAIQPEAERPGKAATPALSSDMVPFVLGDTGSGWEGHKTDGADRAAQQKPMAQVPEVPVELKALRAPPASRHENLVAPGAPGEATSAKAATPEIPLLPASREGLERLPSKTAGGAVLEIKPLPGQHQVEEGQRMIRSAGIPPRPQDYLQVRDEMDSRLVEIYERFYKKRRH